jgi:hypothetical protein
MQQMQQQTLMQLLLSSMQLVPMPLLKQMP